MKIERISSVCVALCFVLCASSSIAASPNYGHFWHVTDFHYDHTYNTSHLSCNANVDNRSALGDYWCDSPWTLVTRAIGAMAAIKSDVDFVLWTGDTVAHISNDNLSMTINMDVVQNLTTALADAFPTKTVYAAFGNHDYYPASQFPDVSNFIYNHTAEMWRRWIVEEEQLRNFRRGGYYTRSLTSPTNGKLRMVVLNTNLYYTSDKVTPGIEDPCDQFSWLRSTLQQARNSGEKVIVAAHIPPGIHTPRGVQWYQETFSQLLISIFKDFADVIKAMHFGHDHYDGFKVLTDNDGRPAVPIFVSPSVTPWRFKLSTGEIGLPHNPAIRLVTYDRDTGDHRNIQQYYLDLSAAISSQTADDFNLLYSFTEHYKVSDVSAASLDTLITRMDSDTEGGSLLDDYYRFSMSAAKGEACDEQCKVRIKCGLRHLSMAEFNMCTEGTGAASRLLSPLSLLLVVGSVLLFWLTR